MENEAKTGIILANTGTPDDPSPEAVKRYLKQFLNCSRIVPMNRLAWSVILNAFILPKRSVKSAEKYATIWDGEFAFIRDHRELARKLGESYDREGRDIVVEYAMSFGNPSIADAMQRLADAGCGKLVVLPLYPQNAFSQASIVADEVERFATSLGWTRRYTVVGDYSDEPAYLEAITASIHEAGFNGERDRLLMSFHSIPQADIDAGDTYGETSARTADEIARRLDASPDAWSAGYQSRFDRSRAWLGPSTSSVLERFAAQDFPGKLFVACPNFAVDCLETYHDILVVMQSEWKRLRKAAGFEESRSAFEYVPCLGASDRHVSVIHSVLDGVLR